MFWDLYLADTEGNEEQANSVPYTISDIKQFMESLPPDVINVGSVLLLPASDREAKVNIQKDIEAFTLAYTDLLEGIANFNRKRWLNSESRDNVLKPTR